jgi:hypothetical protein
MESWTSRGSNAISVNPVVPLTAEFPSPADGARNAYIALRHSRRSAIHLYVDMQRMLRAHGMEMPWLDRGLPNVVAITAAHPDQTIFTRFTPLKSRGRGERDVLMNAGLETRRYAPCSSMSQGDRGLRRLTACNGSDPDPSPADELLARYRGSFISKSGK